MKNYIFLRNFEKGHWWLIGIWNEIILSWKEDAQVYTEFNLDEERTKPITVQRARGNKES